MKTDISATLPPATDKEALIGMYGALFTARGVENHLPTFDIKSFDHPIKESREIIIGEFFEADNKIKQLAATYKTVELVQIKGDERRISFFLECTGTQEQVIDVPPTDFG